MGKVGQKQTSKRVLADGETAAKKQKLSVGHCNCECRGASSKALTRQNAEIKLPESTFIMLQT
eukprot:6492163-Amphidinium_carterae.1